MKRRKAASAQLLEQFGRRVRYLRRLRDLTQEQLAEYLHVSVNTISNIERGEQAPSFAMLEQIATVLEVAIGDLFDFSQHRTSSPRRNEGEEA